MVNWFYLEDIEGKNDVWEIYIVIVFNIIRDDISFYVIIKVKKCFDGFFNSYCFV